jgi:putative peptidoglycan lipid II flippase
MVRRVLNLVYSEIRGLHQAAYILALFAFGSQMLALVRDRLLAHSFGAGAELDLYYAAFRVPDLLYVLFVSVLSVYVLLPFVTKARAEKGNTSAAEVLSQMFSVFLYFYVALAALLFMTAPYYIPVLFPGFGDNNDTLVLLMRILLLQPFLLGLSSLCGVVTQLSHRFVIYAISPLIYNIAIIFGIIVLYPYFGLSGLAWGVVLGAFGHVLVQWPLVAGGELRFGLVRKVDWVFIKSVFTVAIPRALTLSTHQLVLLVFVGIATMLVEGSVSVFQFAFNLQSVPLAIIGMSYSVAAFPVLADLYAKQNHEDFNNHLMTALRHIIFWSFPITALVIVLRAQIVRVVLGSGAFDWNDTRLTAAVLAIFMISLVAQSMLLLLVRAFYAGGKTRVPLLTALFGAIVSLVTAVAGLYFYHNLASIKVVSESLLRLSGVEGSEVLVLALAFVVGTLAELIILLVLVVKNFNMSLRVLRAQLTESFLASLVGGMVAYLTLIFVVDGINQETFVGIMLQGGVAGLVGLIAIIITYYLLGSKELQEIYRSYHAKIFKTDVIAPQQDTL